MKQSITAADAEKIRGKVIASDFFRRFGYNSGVWVSGCSTPVYPVAIWKGELEIQLAGSGIHRGRSAAFRRVLRQLRRTYPQITGQFWRNDGSCPDTYTIYFNN